MIVYLSHANKWLWLSPLLKVHIRFTMVQNSLRTLNDSLSLKLGSKNRSALEYASKASSAKEAYE